MRTKHALSALTCMALLTLPAIALAQQPGIQLVKHHNGYHQVCDADGDDCRWVANAPAGYYRQCDADGDDCHWTNGYGPQYWRQHGGYDYGAPLSWYRSEAPDRYSPVQQRDWLIRKRQAAYTVLERMRAPHDLDAQRRMQ